MPVEQDGPDSLSDIEEDDILMYLADEAEVRATACVRSAHLHPPISERCPPPKGHEMSVLHGL